MEERAPYVHGSSDDERDRLELMNCLINDACLRRLALEDERAVLDVGSGLGSFANAIADALPSGERRVIGVERDDRQIDRARRLAAGRADSRVEFRQGSAEALPLTGTEWGTFDLAHARFLLEHHPDPQAVVQEMTRAVRPGGRIVLADDDHELLRLEPPAPRVLALWRAYAELYGRLGNDPFVGRRLVSLLVGAGALPRTNDWLFYGACAGNASFDGIVDNLRGVLSGASGLLLEHRLAQPQDVATALDELADWRRRHDAAYWYAICWAEGVRPGASI